MTDPADSGLDGVSESSVFSRTEPLWTVEEVARYLRIKPETVRMMARAKSLPALKVGKVWRFRAREIKETLRSNAAEAEGA